MPTTLREFLAKLAADSNPLYANEESTKIGAVQPVLTLLGWDFEGGREVRPEFPVGTDRVDYCLISGPRKIFIEAKVAGANLNGHESQLLGYAFQYGVELAALTTGLEWWLYLPLKRGTWKDRRFAVIDVQKDDDAAYRLDLFLSRRAVLDGSALEAAEGVIIGMNLPQVWIELYKEQRDLLVESLGRKLRDQTGYEPVRSQLEDFLDRQVGLFSRPTQTLYGAVQASEPTNPFRPGSRFGQIYEALLKGVPKEGGLDRLARQLEIDPRNARSVFKKGYGGIGDQGRWRLTVEGAIERLIPEQDAPPTGVAGKVLEVLRDGQWHTSPELREKLRVSSINHVLRKLQGEGKVELSREHGRYRARLLGDSDRVQS